MRARSTIIATVALALTLAACSASPAPTPSTSPAGTAAPGTVPSGSLTLPPIAPTPDPPGVHRFNTYWMRDCPTPELATEVVGCRLALGESRTTPSDDVARAAVEALMAGPNPAEAADHLGTNIRDIAVLNSLKVEGDLATIDFNRYFETAKTRPQTAQVVYALTQFPNIKRVQILVDNITNGAIGANPLTRADVAEFTPPIVIESPTLNATVPHRFKVTGSAVSADGELHYRIETPDGTKHSEGSAPLLGAHGQRGTVLLPITIPDTITGPVILLVYEAGDTGPATEVTTPARIPLVVA
jgi:hypothetical protein